MTQEDISPIIKAETGEVHLSRKGLPVYKHNPFMVATAEGTNQGTRRRTLRSKDGSQLMVTTEAGEQCGPAGFWTTQEVDKTKFVKLYVNGVKAFAVLSSAGTKVFELMYLSLQKEVGKDVINLVFLEIDQSVTRISRTIFQRGLRELCLKGFLAETVMSGRYFVNPDYVFNGDRLALVKEYRVKRDIASDQAWREKAESAGQLRLDVAP